MPIQNNTQRLTLAAMFLALGMLLPFFTGNNQMLGSMLCLMHLPILLCGFVCGWEYGLAVGIWCPLLRSFTIGMPPIMPVAVAMSFELGTYGLLSALFFRWFSKKWGTKPWVILISLLPAMVGGRLVLGLANALLQGSKYSLNIWLTGAFVTAWPGILLQIVLIPTIMTLLMAWQKKQNA